MDETSGPSSAKICSDEENYLVTNEPKRLKCSQVPCSTLQINPEEESKGNFEFINIKMKETDSVGENNEEADNIKDIKLTSEIEIDADCNNAASSSSRSMEYDVKPEIQSIKIERCSVVRDSKVSNSRVTRKDAEVQVEEDSTEVWTCFSNITKNSDITVVTGIKSFELLNEIVDKLERAYDSKYEIPGKRFRTFDRVVLTFAKLKHDLPYDMLSILFQSSAEDCERIFLETEERLKNCNLIPKLIKVSNDE